MLKFCLDEIEADLFPVFCWSYIKVKGKELWELARKSAFCVIA
jgi:hypothetical protein